MILGFYWTSTESNTTVTYDKLCDNPPKLTEFNWQIAVVQKFQRGTQVPEMTKYQYGRLGDKIIYSR